MVGLHEETAEELVRNLDEYRLELEDPDTLRSWEPGALTRTTLVHRGAAQTYLAGYLPELTFTAALRLGLERESMPLLLFGQKVSEKSAASLRDAGIDYLDAAGNAHIAFGKVFIDVRGRRPRSSPTLGRSVERWTGVERQPHRPANLFSPRRAQVVFCLLVWPELAGAGIREIARSSGVSLGQAHESLKALEEFGYLVGGKTRRIVSSPELFEHWVAAYRVGLGPSLALADYRGDLPDFHATDPAAQVWVSGESAVPELLRPATLTIYVDELDRRLPLRNRWRADARPNVFVRRKFWSAPDHDDHRDVVGRLVAPWLLVYADLQASGDARQREAAAQLWERHVGLQQV